MLGRGHDGKRDISNLKLWSICFGTVYGGKAEGETLQITDPRHKVKMKITQLCLPLCHPMDYTVHGLLQARILEWVAIPFSRGSSRPRDQIQVSLIAGGFFTSCTTREA